VVPVITYASAVWGTKSFSCVNAVHHRAMRFFLGTGKYTPIVAVQGDMGWKPIIIDQWKSVCNHWHRCLLYNDCRINKKIFNWSVNKGNNRCKNWPFIVRDKLCSIDLDMYTMLPFDKNKMLNDVCTALMNSHIVQWQTDLNRYTGVNGTNHNKLRTYRLFKSSYDTELYCKLQLPYCHRSALSKFRCGVAPLRIETGRYTNMPVAERVCPFCEEFIETEMHVLLQCPLYNQIRDVIYEKAQSVDNSFYDMSDNDKFVFMFSHPDMVRILAKSCCDILKIRNNILYSKNFKL
jgi:hypothetical protein